MSLHKLTAGDGYTYLTRQVAAHDSTEKGHVGLGDYYSQRGESPGRWRGAGLQGLAGIGSGDQVSESQMKALFGEGRHPDAEAIEAQVIAAGGTSAEALAASSLGNRFPVYEAANAFRTACAQRFGDFNAEIGFPGDWPVPAADRARIRTEVGGEMFAAEFGRPPADPRELSGFIARASRPATTAVAGYDLTFTPVKSVSALWAIAPREISERIQAVHDAAVADTLAWLEKEAVYTRTGRGGVRQVEVTGLIAAVFTHRDSRSGDPNLHTHVGISNKVQTRDGRWLALDGRVLHKATVSASEYYNTRSQVRMVEEFRLEFAERPDTDPGKRPVREIVGMDPRLNTTWSSRRVSIDARRAELAAQFQADYGRPPTTIEAIQLAQQATLETRQAKHEPRTLAEQRAAWRRQAIEVLGSGQALSKMVRDTMNRRAPATRVTRRWIRKNAAGVLNTVEGSRATWQVWHIRAEAERRARAAGIGLADLNRVVDAVVAEALSPSRSLPLGVKDPVSDPAILRRSTGDSVYTVAGSQLYTSPAIVAAERRLIDAAERRDGRRLDLATVDLAILESAANHVELNPGQAQLVRQLATSGARLQLAIAPAGSGKTTAMRVLSRAWQDGGGDVIGLAPSAVAAAELRSQIGSHTDTLAKLTYSLTTGYLPEWVRQIGPRTLVVIDEAGMAGTADLAQAVDYIIGRGASVRLVGDDRQLASVAAGGVLRDIAETAGAVTLSQLIRFADPAEGAATLALRAGDPAAIGFYIDHGRVHVGDETTVTDHAYRAWQADRAAGRDSVMLAPTRELVAILNARARADRLAGSPPAAAEVALADGNRASAGDTILTRRNERRLAITSVDWVKNGDRWTVEEVLESGAVSAIHLQTSRRVLLPAAYIAEYAELGYAATVHGAQGITADTCYVVATGAENRQLLYVALTRGRDGNYVYLVTAGDGDPHSVITPAALFPPTAVDLLTAVLVRDEAQRSASTLSRELTAPGLGLHEAVSRYHDALGLAAETMLGAERLAALDAAAEQIRAGLTASPAYPTLRAHLALIAVDGRDPLAALRHAGASRELGSANDPAAVLDWRLDPTGRRSSPTGPLPWLPAVPSALAADPQWGGYLSARAERITALAGQVSEQAAGWTPTTAPAWAPRFLEAQYRQLLVDLALWRSANAIAEHDRRPAGGPQLAAAAAQHQGRLEDRVAAVFGDPNHTARRWVPLADSVDTRVSQDPYWPELADRLAALDRAGIDAAGMFTAVAGERPLPDEQPAAALWWRMSAHLAPAALGATAGSGASTLRPPWTPMLLNALPPDRGERVLADPSWPALVAAINHAERDGWRLSDLLPQAVRQLDRDAFGAGPVSDSELTTALVWHIGMLTDPEPLDLDQPHPPDPADEALTPPHDLHTLDVPGDPASPLTDADVLSLPAREPDDETAPPDPDEQLDTRPRRAAQVPDGPAPAAVSRVRLLELNGQALEHFRSQYLASWAPAYLAERLGTDLHDDPRFAVGYAPAGWRNLTDQLRSTGATDDELVAAGLGQCASNGRVIDRFRDRLIMPIYNGRDLAGFIGRRNPEDDDAGPKYLNTSDTALFSKGAQLYGQSEGRDLLARGAAPVLVEGPLDAIATTLAGNGDAVGVAPLGTAFTEAQADLLRPYIGEGKPGVIVATDADTAGARAAERAYWQLTARGDSPRHLLMADGYDPASLLQHGGAPALAAALDDAQSLARTLVDNRIAAEAHPDTVEGHIATYRAAAQIIGALPPQHWLEHINYVTETTDAIPGSVHLAVIDAGEAWMHGPHADVAAGGKTPSRPPTPDWSEHLWLYEPTTSTTPGQAEEHWRQLADSINPAIAAGRDWPALAAEIDRADARGKDVTQLLPELAAAALLPNRQLATELQYRLLAATQTAAARAEGRDLPVDVAASRDRRQEPPPDPGIDQRRPPGRSR